MVGLPELESENEDLKDSVGNVFDVLVEKPSFEVDRIGKLKRNDSTKNFDAAEGTQSYRECVEELCRRCRDDTSKSHFNRDGLVVSVVKEKKTGENG